MKSNYSPSSNLKKKEKSTINKRNIFTLIIQNITLVIRVKRERIWFLIFNDLDFKPMKKELHR
jgi:hypothetical protein